jgi:hypothetical protein
LIAALVVVVTIVGCGQGGSGIKKPDHYAPPPNDGDRVRFDDDSASGNTEKIRITPRNR